MLHTVEESLFEYNPEKLHKTVVCHVKVTNNFLYFDGDRECVSDLKKHILVKLSYDGSVLGSSLEK